jgi:hypothetical protein
MIRICLKTLGNFLDGIAEVTRYSDTDIYLPRDR